MFKVSVKGIAESCGSHLLRVNERDEYELLGGKLERSDRSLAYRVRQEFLEESGLEVQPRRVLEPWFYVFGDRPVLIVPLLCEVVCVPEVMVDQDGGRLEWVEEARLSSIDLPKSYRDSICARRPRLMRHGGISGPQYADDLFRVMVVVRQSGEERRQELREACDFAEYLRGWGCTSAQFDTVRYEGGQTLEVVFDVCGGCVAKHLVAE